MFYILNKWVMLDKKSFKKYALYNALSLPAGVVDGNDVHLIAQGGIYFSPAFPLNNGCILQLYQYHINKLPISIRKQA
jgi:hypothetical protein